MCAAKLPLAESDASSLTFWLLFGERWGPFSRESIITRPHHSNPTKKSSRWMGVIDAFVSVHNDHRHNTNHPGNFEDCMEGRIRLLTAITPTYAHAYQSICLAGARLTSLIKIFACRLSKAKYPSLPDIRTTTREKGNDLKGWAVYTAGGTHVSEG